MTLIEEMEVSRQPVVIEEQIVKVLRGHSIPEGWRYARHIYETTDLIGTWDVILVQRALPPEVN